MRPLALALGLWLSATPALAGAPPAVPPAVAAAGVDEQLGRQISADLAFTDHHGRAVRSGDLFDGARPIVLVLAYYRCPTLCGLVLRGAVQAIDDLALELGADFDAVTLSVDPRDSPDAAAAKRRSVIAALKKPGGEGRWPFLVGAASQIERLAAEVGFGYAYDARTDQYAHPAVIIVLTPTGRVSRYLHGISPSARDLRLALTEAREGKTGGLVDRILLTCYRYDPAARAYGPYVLGFVRLGGALVLLAVLGTLGALFYRERKRQ